MGSISVFIVALLLAVMGIVIGFRVGQGWALHVKSRRQYWVCNAVAYVVGIVVSAFVGALGLVVLVFAVIGVLGGVIAGLKFGYGPEGPWKKLDKMMGVKNRHLQNQPLPKGQKEPELISVQDPGPIKDRRSRREG